MKGEMRTARLRLVRLSTPWARFWGLLPRRCPPGPRTGVWLLPCRAVHTLGMAYAVDVAFIGADGKVLRALRLVPWRFALCTRAVSVVETRLGVMVDDECQSTGRLEQALQGGSSIVTNAADTGAGLTR